MTTAIAGSLRPAAFLDRDGVLNVDVAYLHRIEDFQWIDGAPQAIRRLNDLGYLVFVVTNQSGVARGYYSEDDVHRLHAFMGQDLARVGAHIDAFRHCPHLPDGSVEAYRQDCRCRKPEPGMVEDLLAAYPVDVARSFIIGDRQRDLDAGAACGVRGFLYQKGNLDAFVADAIASMQGAGS